MTKDTYKFQRYGWIGLSIMIMAGILLFRDNQFIKRWFTPIMWSGYIMLLDAIIHKLRGSSLIKNRPSQFWFMLPYSVICWLIFEAYNLHLRNWQYIGMPENMAAKYVGYVWAFATIWPGVLLTSELVDIWGIFDKVKLPKFKFKKSILYFISFLGLACVIIPILVPAGIAAYLFGPVWIGFVFFLDPINYFMGAKSLFRELENGRLNKVFSLFLAGAICGLLWEFWNYWAVTKWVYTLPFLMEPKIFEMPVFGFIGFLPFAVEVYVMWEFAVRILKFDRSRLNK